MLSRYSRILILLIVAGIFAPGCNGSGTDPNGNTTHIDIGDTIPRKHSNYSYNKAQLDMSNTIIPGTKMQGFFSIVDTTGFQVLGKSNVYFMLDDGDTSYYAYEPTSDVSVYLQNPGYTQNFGYLRETDQPLQTILDLVFHNWIRLPIATKDTGVVAYNGTNTVILTGDPTLIQIRAIGSFVGDSTLTIGASHLLAKHCKITITAILDPLRYPEGKVITHVRDIWFVPKIGNIALQTTRTYVPEIHVVAIPLDTTATLKVLTNYTLF